MNVVSTPFHRAFGRVVAADAVDFSLAIDELRSLLGRYGLLLFRGGRLDARTFDAFTSMFVDGSLAYGGARQRVTDDDFVQLVEPGRGAIALHSENAFTPFRPDVCCFGCERPALEGGHTTVCDGVSLWRSLAQETRDAFLRRRIRYSRAFPRAAWERTFKTRDVEVVARYLDRFAPSFSYAFRGDGALSTHYVTRAVVQTSVGAPAFTNSVANMLARGDYEGSSVRFEDEEPIASEIVEDVTRAIAALTVPIEWREGDVAVLDNWRVMHGRTAFSGDHRRIFARFGFLSAASIAPPLDHPSPEPGRRP